MSFVTLIGIQPIKDDDCERRPGEFHDFQRALDRFARKSPELGSFGLTLD